jgi:hypothetical protein
MDKQSISMKVIRGLVIENDAAQLEKCIDTQLSAGTNPCLRSTGTEAVVAALARAAFVRGSIDREEMSLNEAVRLLGERMRRYSG